MGKGLAVAVIHGVGSQGDRRPADTAVPTFSRELKERVAERIGTGRFEETTAWREIFWADITQSRQNEYLEQIKDLTRYDGPRSFVVHNLGDASAYRRTVSESDQTYERIHQRVADTLEELEADVDEGAPLVVLAHSLGGHIVSNYIWDKNHLELDVEGLSGFQKMNTLGGLVTFGCPIPIFVFALDPDEVIPIDYPGTDLPEAQREPTWWRNFYDPDDILAFPLEHTEGYDRLADEGQLKDFRVNVGTFFESLTPASHNGYWRDDDFTRPVADFLERWTG